VKSLMDFFSVDNAKLYDPATGEEHPTNIQMVYNGTSCGLNESLWAPWFGLPTMDTMARTVDLGYWAADNDYGEMFLNFWQHDELRPYCGVDLSKLYPKETAASGRPVLWEVWTRPAMGLRPSPYVAYQGALIAKQVSLGAPDDETPFSWKTVELNLPGNVNYRPERPWVSKR